MSPEEFLIRWFGMFAGIWFCFAVVIPQLAKWYARRIERQILEMLCGLCNHPRKGICNDCKLDLCPAHWELHKAQGHDVE